MKLAALIDWEVFEREWAGFFSSGKGRPATEPRLVAGLLYLQHAYRLSDEAVGFVVGMRSFPGNPYDGHTLKEALEQVEILTDQRPDLAVVDRGYRGHGETRIRVLISGTRRGLKPKLIADLRRRSAIEAEIGHMKTDGRLSRCPLKGTIGDALFAALCACGHNIRKILAHLRAWLAWIVAAILNADDHPGRQDKAVTSV